MSMDRLKQMKNILVPMDFSESSMWMLKTGRIFAERMNARLHVLAVIDEVMLNNFNNFSPKYARDIMQNSEENLKAYIKDSRIEEIEHTSELISGVPFMEIISKAGEINADLILLGGLISDASLSLGNDSYQIIRIAPFNTFLLKYPGNKSAEPIIFNKILVALDFSPHSVMALEYSLMLKKIFDSKLIILHISTNGGDSGVERIRIKLKEFLSAEQLDVIDGIEVLCSQNPAQKIIERLMKNDIDLMTIGSHSKKRFLRNIFLGKVAYDVVRKVKSSILVVKDTEMGA